jgi:predicted ferric reductase
VSSIAVPGGTGSGAAPRRPVAPGNHQLRSTVAVGLIGLGAIPVVGLWWKDTPAFSGLGPWLTNAGRVTGLLAGYGLAIALILMSRAPLLERGLGADTLARWHSQAGRYVVSLIAAHTALIIWGYSVTAHDSLTAQTGTLLTSYPDVLMATVAGAMLVSIGVISARKARAKLRYETWYYLHLYTYLAVALSFSHEFATGADFTSSRPARILWSALYLAAIGLVVGYRIVTPVRDALRHRLRVNEIRRESADTVSIHVGGRRLADLQAQPGHFFRWRFITRDHWWQSHPYSLSAVPDERSLRITVKGLGDHSQALQRIEVGTRVIAEGPYGALTAARRRRRKILLLAGGVGITPLRALFEALPGRGGDVTLIVRANDADDVVFRHELDAIAARRNARVHYMLGPPGAANDPLVGHRLREVVPDVDRHDVYVCGPPGFMAAAERSLRACRVPRRCIHREYFSF